MTRQMQIKNWDRFQHYKHRSPPWIRLYADLLNDPDWADLSGDAVKLLVSLWLIASDEGTEGYLPDSRTLAFRLRVDSKRLDSLLSELGQWVVLDASTMLAECVQHAIPESESETESERESEGESESEKPPALSSNGGSPLKGVRECPDGWHPTVNTLDTLRSEGFSERVVSEAAREMMDWSQSGGKRKKDWNATLRNWVRRNQKSATPAKTRTRHAMERIASERDN